MKREFKQVFKMTYCVLEALQENTFIEFCNGGDFLWSVTSSVHIQFFHERRSNTMSAASQISHIVLPCWDFGYKLITKDDTFDRGQRNLSLFCPCMCNITAERLRSKLNRSLLSWAGNRGMFSLVLCYRGLQTKIWLQLSVALLFVSIPPTPSLFLLRISI